MTTELDYEMLPPIPVADPELYRMEQRAMQVYNYDLDRDDEGQFEIRRQFVQEFCTYEPMRRRPRRPLNGRPLRVGYLGSDFYGWSGNWIFGPVILSHTPAIEPYCYSYTRVSLRNGDKATQLYKSRTTWRDVSDYSVADVAALIDQDEIDILVDLMGYSFGLPLSVLMLKPAPVQVTAWGHVSGGTGLSTVDYLFADPIACPESIRSFYTEQIVDLPCVIRYTPPFYLPDLAVSKGRPFRFLVPHRFRKVTDRAVACWAEILRRVPDAELVIKAIDIDATDETRRTICRRLQAISEDVSHRILIVSVTSPEDHLRMFWHADVTLDTIPFNGGVVSMESLVMGVPFVTRRGRFLAARVGASILHTVGMDDWIADSDEAYIDIAVRAAGQRDRLAEMRGKLRPHVFRSPLCDIPSYVAAVETRYRAIAQEAVSSRLSLDAGN